MSLETLEILWYLVFIAVLAGYTVLDGFDLGVGALHLFTKKDEERRIFLNAIGPVWDGNEVWLVVLGGSLFAGFPFVYATLLSAFYIPVMALLAGLIFRAVSIEFRSKKPQMWWRNFWDRVFSVGSIAISLGLGFVLGNLVHGIKLDANHEYMGTFGDFFHIYTILVAVMTLAMFMMHGAIFLTMKTEGALHEKMRHWVNRTIIFYFIMFFVVTAWTLIFEEHMVTRFKEQPWVFVIALANVLALANVPRAIKHKHDGFAFLSSCFSILCLVALYAMGTFPTILRAVNDPANLSLTIENSYASAKTLKILLIIVCIGIPLAVAYIISVYYIFRGKVKLDSHSY